MLDIWREHGFPTLIREIEKSKKKARQSKRKPFIACLKSGGLGDYMDLIAFSRAVRRKYKNAWIVIFSRYFQYDKHDRDSDPINYIADRMGSMPGGAINHTMTLPSAPWSLLVRNLRPFFDIFFDVQYAIGTYRSDSMLDNSKEVREQVKADLRLRDYQKFYDNFPGINGGFEPVHGNKLEVMSSTSGLKITEDDYWIPVDEAQEIPKEKYVTFHNGAGRYANIKVPSIELYKGVDRFCKKLGLKTVQVGTKNDGKIGCDYTVTDGANIGETAAIIKKAELHIGPEGGLAYIAKAVKTRSMIFFGPTPHFFFGFTGNINLPARIKCRPCWWHGPTWGADPCPKGFRECVNFPTLGEVQDYLLAYFVDIEKTKTASEDYLKNVNLQTG